MMVCRLAQLGRHVDADADVGVIIVVINAASSSHPDPVRAWVRSQALLAILRLTSKRTTRFFSVLLSVPY